MALAAQRPELFGTRVVGVALLSTSSGNLADLTFGLPELLTRVRAAVFPVAAWTMRRRPGLRRAHPAAGRATSSRRSPARCRSPPPTSTRRWSHYVDAMIAGTPVDVIAEFYPALAGLDETGALEPLRAVPTLVLTGDAGQDDPEGAQRADRRAPRRTREFVVVPDAGHMVLLEKPAEVDRGAHRALRRVGGRARGRAAG